MPARDGFAVMACLLLAQLRHDVLQQLPHLFGPGLSRSVTPLPWFCQRSRQSRRHELEEEFSSCGFEYCQHSRGATEMKVAAAVGGNVLAVTGARAEKIAKLVIAAAEALGRGEALEAAHTSCAPFHAPVILLKSVVLVRAGPMHDPPAERRADRPWARSEER